jgi:RND family efflux transporter MFP subunit
MTRGRLVAALIAAAILLALIAGLYQSQKKRKAQAAATAPTAQAVSWVELAPTDLVQVKPVEIKTGLPVSGSLRATHSALVKARVAGELQGLTVREGDAVRAGQVLARIDPTEYQARLRQAQQQADAAKAQIDISQRQLENNRALVAQNFISQTALEASLSNLQVAQANHRAALAAVDVARKNLDDTSLLAPLSGRVAQRLAQPGERMAIDARVLEIVDTSRLELEASVSAAESLQLKIGQTAQLRIEGSDQVLQGRLVRINPVAQSASRSVMAYLSIDNRAAVLRQGLYVQGQLETGSKLAPAVPLSAVRTDQAQPYVQLLRQDAVVHQPVRLGTRGTIGDEMMVTVDLPEGAQVLRASVGPLREGLPARITSLSQPSGGKP